MCKCMYRSFSTCLFLADWTTIARRPHFLQQFAEVAVAMAVAFSLKVQVVMAKLMFDNGDQFFLAELLVMF